MGEGPDVRAVRGSVCEEKCPAGEVKCPKSADLLQNKHPINVILLFLCLRTSPRLLCVATQQKNPGQNVEEEQSQSPGEQKAEASPAEKMLGEEKARLEEQLKEVTVSALWRSLCLPPKLHASHLGGRFSALSLLAVT